ncbi:hypothetical protein N7535_001597 [Penicillium sp. DV-2018c]|nr:hypothetical protein N7535_001597 [Penicillium sp. DV-2018c]
MADYNSSPSELLEELGFAPSEHQFLLRLLSSDPLSGLSHTDVETSDTPPLRPHSSNLASSPDTTSLRQDIYSSINERVQQLHLSESQGHTSSSHKGSEGRETSNYAEEWTSLIAAESESLISELNQLPVSDNEAPHESPQLPPYPGKSANDVHPGSAEYAASSVYSSSESGEPPDSFDIRSETPGEQVDYGVPQDPRTLNGSGTFTELLESFPTPPNHTGTTRERSFSHHRVPSKDSAPANTWSFVSNRVSSVISSPRISRFSENLSDSGLIGEHQADTSALETSGLVLNTPPTSPGLSTPPSLGTSLKDRRLQPSQSGTQGNLENSVRPQKRAFQYSAFPKSLPRVHLSSYKLRRQCTHATLFNECHTPKSTPRFYRQRSARIYSRPSVNSFATRGKPKSKCHSALKGFAQDLKNQLRRARRHLPFSSKR